MGGPGTKPAAAQGALHLGPREHFWGLFMIFLNLIKSIRWFCFTQVLQQKTNPTPENQDDAEPGPGRVGPLLDSVRPGDHAHRPQVGRLHLGRPDGGRGTSQVQIRPAAEPRGEAAAAEGHGQVPLGPRHPGADPGGGVQRGLRGAAEAAAHLAPRQETLQDRDPQTGYLLHLLSEPRVGRVRATRTPPAPRGDSRAARVAAGLQRRVLAPAGYGIVDSRVLTEKSTRAVFLGKSIRAQFFGGMCRKCISEKNPYWLNICESFRTTP